MKQKQGQKKRITRRFYLNIAIFVLIVGLGLIFRDEYVTLRDTIRSKVVLVAEGIIDGIQTGDINLKMPTLNDIVYGANNKPLTGEGVRVDESAAGSPTNTGEEYAFSTEQYPYRAMLNDEARQIYNQVYANALEANAKQFTLVKRVTQDALQTIMSAVYNDHPELFWVDTAYSFGYLGNGDVITVTLSYNDSVKNLDQNKQQFQSVVAKIIQGAAQYGNNVDKEKYVHDYLMDNVEYDETAQMHQSAYSALVLGKSVCAGYSRAFQHILMEIGIPCYYTTGTAAGGSHAWNIVSINGDYYNVDTSWDDATGTAYGTLCYTYFNLPDTTFSADHTRDELSDRLPACNGTAMSYNAVYGESDDVVSTSSKYTTFESLGYTKDDIINTMADYNRYCQAELIRLGTGEHTLTMVLANSDLLDDIYASARNGSYVEAYAQSVVNVLKLKNCEISLNMRGESLANGYVLLKQTVTLTGTQGETVTPAPTKAPTPTPTPIKTSTPVPTQTPMPTSTATVSPSHTPEQTDTPEPTQEPTQPPVITAAPANAATQTDVPEQTTEAAAIPEA